MTENVENGSGLPVPEELVEEHVEQKEVPTESLPADGGLRDEPLLTPPPSNEEALSEVLAAAPQKLEEKFMDLRNLPEVLAQDIPSKTVQQDYELYEPCEFDPNLEAVAYPGLKSETINSILNEIRNSDILNTPEGQRWFELLRASSVPALGGAAFQDAVDREGSKWRQYVLSTENNRPMAGQPLNFRSEPGRISGENAVFRAQSLTGLGATFNFPLYHTGIWLTLKAPQAADLLELNRRLAEEKIRLGRMSYGEAFSNLTVFFCGQIIDFAMEHLYRVSVKDDEEWRDLIDARDVPTIAWGLAATIYPRGHQYVRSVVGDENEPLKTISQKVKLPRMLWTNHSTLTDWQRAHMSKRMGKQMTREQIIRYQEESVAGRELEITLKKGDEVDGVEEGTNDIRLTLRTPKMEEYFNSGERWLNGIIAKYEYAAGMDNLLEERQNYFMTHANATLARQFAHYVKEINMAGQIVDTVEDIEKVLDVLSGDLEILKTFSAEVGKFISNGVMSMIAVTTTDNTESPFPRMPNLIPVDPISSFFILLVQRTKRIQTQ